MPDEMSARTLFQIANAVKKAVEKHGRSQFSLTHLHEDFGAPAPAVAGAYLGAEANLLRFWSCLNDLRWEGAPPLYVNGIVYVPEWSDEVRELWFDCVTASHRAEKIAALCRQQVLVAEQSTRQLLAKWANQATDEAIKIGE
jgi:hypothetical protein